MHYAPRTIAFVCELLHPPQTPDPAPIQRIHNEMFQGPDPAYQSFHALPQGAVLSNPVTKPGAASTAEFLADRIRFREELSGLTVDSFASRIATVVARAAELRGLQLFTAQSVVVRTLVNPRNFADSRTFLKSGMFGFEAETEAFGRDPQLLGLRLVFPPSQEEPFAFSLRVESYSNDPRSTFLENHGTFGPTIVARGLESIGRNIERTYEFVTTRALSFLEQFDARLEA
ncbi:MAG: hypothetical protein AAF682_29745 [Planctomycetota bacterium]